MQIKHFALLTIAALALAVTGCGDKKAADTKDTKDAGSKPSSDHIFDEKSGMVEMKMSMMGMEPLMTLYFDDYGKKTATVVKMDMFGKQMVQHAIVVGDTTIKWDEEKMEGSKVAKDKSSDQQMSLTAYMNMDDARKKALNYKEIEPKEVLGKQATGFSIDTTTAGGTVSMKIWQWHNIPVYMEATSQGVTVKIEATKIEVPSDVPASVFEVPANVKFGAAGADPMGGAPGSTNDTGAATPKAESDTAKK